MANLKSDVDAKAAFAEELRGRGFDSVKITAAPADITATRDGEVHYYEVKYTGKDKDYFGAATLTEWQAARDHEDRFTFVVAFKRNDHWVFHEYTPAEFMTLSNIPPFKIFFNIRVDGEKDVSSRRRSTSVALTWDRLHRMKELFDEFRSENP
ncbi:MAG: protein NO VEIN domain-containing protein [Planctomycetota bacterium]